MTDQIDEIGLQLRTAKSTESLQSRIKPWDGVDPEQLGLLVLDDLLLADVTSGLKHSVFLYESMLLCCQDSVNDESLVDGVLHSFDACYPIAKWELGPAMRCKQPLDILFKVPTNLFKSVRRVSAGTLEFELRRLHLLTGVTFQVLWKLTGSTTASSTPIHLQRCLWDNAINGIWRCSDWCRQQKVSHPSIHPISYQTFPCYRASTCTMCSPARLKSNQTC